ncbi:MAG: RHS repeat-associated core domain-containing protein [Actinomycetota bacterium]
MYLAAVSLYGDPPPGSFTLSLDNRVEVITQDSAIGDLTGIDDLGGTPNDRGFGYDTWGLTTSATAASTTLTYTLDPFGRTIGRQVGTGSVGAYAYVGLSEDVAADPTSTTVYGPAGPLVTKTGSSVAFSLTDVHSDVVGTLATGSATMSKEYWYSPFGEQKVLAGSTSALGYQGDLTDPDTGTVDMGTRLYVPSLGRFSSRDILFGETSDPMSMNQFTYAGASPITNWDPTGMCADENGHTIACTQVVDDLNTNGPRPPAASAASSGSSGCDSCGGGGPTTPAVRYDFDWLIHDDPDVRIKAGGYYQGPSLGDQPPILVWTGKGLALEWNGYMIADEDLFARAFDHLVNKTNAPLDDLLLHVSGAGTYFEQGNSEISYSVEKSWKSLFTGSLTQVVTVTEHGDVRVPGGTAQVGFHATIEIETPRVPLGPVAVAAAALVYAGVVSARQIACGVPYPAAQAVCGG